MAQISYWGLDPFPLNQLCYFEAFYHISSTLKQCKRYTKEPRTLDTFMPFWRLVAIAKVYSTCGSNFILGYSYWISCAIFKHFTKFNSWVPVLWNNERGIQRATKQPIEHVTSTTFCRLVTLTMFLSSGVLVHYFFFVLTKLFFYVKFLPPAMEKTLGHQWSVCKQVCRVRI
mgnify:CR=1 FL=1